MGGYTGQFPVSARQRAEATPRLTAVKALRFASLQLRGTAALTAARIAEAAVKRGPMTRGGERHHAIARLGMRLGPEWSGGRRRAGARARIGQRIVFHNGSYGTAQHTH